MDSIAGVLYDYLDENTRFCREKCKIKTLTSHVGCWWLLHLKKNCLLIVHFSFLFLLCH